jgi:hypothetical protein
MTARLLLGDPRGKDGLTLEAAALDQPLKRGFWPYGAHF